MGKNSDVSKEIDHTRLYTETTAIDPSLNDATHQGMLLQKEEPNELEHKANQTASSHLLQDQPLIFHQTITITEVTPTLEDKIDDIIITPEVIPSVSEQKALVLIPRRLPPAVMSNTRKSRMMPTVAGSSHKDKQRGKGTLFIVMTAIVLFFVVISGSYVALGANADSGNSNKNPIAAFTFPQLSSTTAEMTITPSHGIVNTTYTIAMVTGQPDSAQRQVEGARIISSSQTQSLQVSATGKVTTPAISSTRALLFSRVRGKKSVIIPAGTPFLDKNNIALVLNAPIILRAKGPVVSVSAHANPAGLRGNVPALDINGTLCYPNCITGTTFHIQNTAFTGGQPAKSYKFIQQNDINSAASQLEHALANTTQTTIQSQIEAYEQQVGSTACGFSSLSSNQQAGAKVPYVTVTVAERCQEEVYSVQAALNLAKELLRNDVTRLVGPGYAIAGSVTTQVLSQPEIIDAQGSLSLKVMASSTAFYQVTPARQQALAIEIAGKSPTEAQDLLSNQPGIARATITISDNSVNTLPNDANKIHVVVVK